MPHTEATYESTQTAAMVDLNHLTACSNHNAKAKEGNKMQIERLATKYKNISKQEEGSDSSRPPTPYVQAT